LPLATDRTLGFEPTLFLREALLWTSALDWSCELLLKMAERVGFEPTEGGVWLRCGCSVGPVQWPF